MTTEEVAKYTIKKIPQIQCQSGFELPTLMGWLSAQKTTNSVISDSAATSRNTSVDAYITGEK